MSQRHYRACHLVIETEGEKILSIKGDKNDPLSRGHICPKAIALKDIHEDPDRLRKPVKKVDGPDGKPRWEEISWEEALDITAQRLSQTSWRIRSGNTAWTPSGRIWVTPRYTTTAC